MVSPTLPVILMALNMTHTVTLDWFMQVQVHCLI